MPEKAKNILRGISEKLEHAGLDRYNIIGLIAAALCICLAISADCWIDRMEEDAFGGGLCEYRITENAQDNGVYKYEADDAVYIVRIRQNKAGGEEYTVKVSARLKKDILSGINAIRIVGYTDKDMENRKIKISGSKGDTVSLFEDSGLDESPHLELEIDESGGKFTWFVTENLVGALLPFCTVRGTVV